MSRINELLKKIRIVSSEPSGVAHWESLDLLGDRHLASISWSENSLRIEKGVEINGSIEPSFAAYWEVSPKGRLLLKESTGLPDQLGSSDALQYIRQNLETGAPPTIAPTVNPSKGFCP